MHDFYPTFSQSILSEKLLLRLSHFDTDCFDQMNEKPYDTTTISFSDHHATLQTMCSFPCRDVNKMSKCHFCGVCQPHKQIIWIDFQHYHRKMFHHYFPWVLFIGLTGHSSNIDQIWHSLPWNRMCKFRFFSWIHKISFLLLVTQSHCKKYQQFRLIYHLELYNEAMNLSNVLTSTARAITKTFLFCVASSLPIHYNAIPL